jgi:hypothetical protein
MLLFGRSLFEENVLLFNLVNICGSHGTHDCKVIRSIIYLRIQLSYKLLSPFTATEDRICCFACVGSGAGPNFCNIPVHLSNVIGFLSLSIKNLPILSKDVAKWWCNRPRSASFCSSVMETSVCVAGLPEIV